MRYAILSAAIAASVLGLASTEGAANDARIDGARGSEERPLRNDDDEARFRAYQPFLLQTATGGVVADSLDAFLAGEEVRAVAMIEVRHASATSIDLDHDVRPGDSFHVHSDQTFATDGVRKGVGRVPPVELRTRAKSNTAIYRFREPNNAERFWPGTGRAASPLSMRLPLDNVTVSSGFGLRSDPFGQSHPPTPLVGKPTILIGKPSLVKGTNRFQTAQQRTSSPSMPRAVAPTAKSSIRNNARVGRSIFMHEGVDLVAPPGTPVYAAADGVVVGAAPNGGYGNWIQIQHREKLATVYGHLMGFASGIEPGQRVECGDLIGFVGSTGRSTGAHLHFEIRVDGKPVDPMNYHEIQVEELRGPFFSQFSKRFEQSLDGWLPKTNR